MFVIFEAKISSMNW